MLFRKLWIIYLILLRLIIDNYYIILFINYNINKGNITSKDKLISNLYIHIQL